MRALVALALVVVAVGTAEAATIVKFDINAKDNSNDIDKLKSPIGAGVQGDTIAPHLQFGSLEEELAKLASHSALILTQKLAAHHEQEVPTRTGTEEYESLQKLPVMQVMRRGPVNVEGKDLGMFFKNEMGQTNEALNDKHKEQLGTNPIHLETKPAALLASFKAELDNYSAQLNKVQLEVEKESTERANELSRLPKQIESNMLPISQLLDAMEQENSFFKNLPKREESRITTDTRPMEAD